MDWTEGYMSDIEYVPEFYPELGPDFLNFACVLNGVEPVPLDGRFSYCELGFGRGATLAVLAAAHPLGRFYGVDFNPAHVAEAEQLAAAAKLDNLTLLERSFAELVDAPPPSLPQFDFITLHGVYTWVGADNRAHLRRFIRRHLKPGGIVYVSFNAMPGWAQLLPLQWMMREAAALAPGQGRLDFARQMVDRLSQLGALDFTGGAPVQARLKTLQTADARYLAHEYLNAQFEPMYHAEVARELADDAKLQYAGSAELPRAFANLYLNPQQQECLAGIAEEPLRQTATDYFASTPFRRDVFVRGARRLALPRQVALLQGYGLALCVPRATVKLSMRFSFGEVNARESVHAPILDALAERPRALSELAQLDEFRDKPPAHLLQAASLLVASHQAAIYPLRAQETAAQSAAALNAELARVLAHGGEARVLTAPLLRSGIAATLIGVLVADCMSGPAASEDAHDIAQRIAPVLTALGHRLEKDAIPLTDAAEHHAHLAQIVTQVLRKQAPVWRQLGIV